MELELKGTAAIAVWPVFLRTLAITSIFYGIQIYFAISHLAGLALLSGIDSSYILSVADLLTFGTASNAGIGLMVVGMVGAMLCGLITFAVSTVIFYSGGCRPFKNFSLVTLSVCTVVLLMPILNFLPIMWLWCLYVAWSNLSD